MVSLDTLCFEVFLLIYLTVVFCVPQCHGADSKQLRAVVAFFTCTMLGTLQREENVNERLLSVVVPQLIRGFKCRSDEYRAACLMVLSQLARVARLKESLLVSLMPVVTRVSPVKLSLRH